MHLPFIHNTAGERSASLTLAVIAFVAVTGWLVAWLVCTPLGLLVPPFDASAALQYLTPILALYFGRRHTDSKGQHKSEESNL